MEITWIKIATDMFEDEKLLIVESMPECDAILVMWTKLMLRAGKCNAGGWIYLAEGRPYTDEMLAAVFRRPVNTVRLALQTLSNLGMIHVNDNGIFIINWEKHQNIKGLENIREGNRLRKSTQRQLQKVTQLSQHCHGTEEEVDIEKEKRKKEEIYKLFDFWNSKGIHIHRKLTNEISAAINTKFKDYSYEDLCKAISNYAEITLSPAYYWAHRWTLKDFLARGIEKFLDGDIARQNYRKETTAAGSAPHGRDPDGYVKGKFGHMVNR